MTAADYVSRMTAINRKKIEMIQLLRDAYRQERLSLVDKNMEAFGNVLEDKQRIMTDVNKLDEQFHVYSERLKTEMAISSLEQLTGFYIPGLPDLKGSTSELIGLLQEIEFMHAEDTRLLQGELARTEQLIGQVRKGKSQARQFGRAYFQRPIQTLSVYFDKKK